MLSRFMNKKFTKHCTYKCLLFVTIINNIFKFKETTKEKMESYTKKNYFIIENVIFE